MNYRDAVQEIKRDAINDFRCGTFDVMQELERRIGTLPRELKRQWQAAIKAIYLETRKT